MSMSVLLDSTTATLSPLERTVRVQRWGLERNVVEEAGEGCHGREVEMEEKGMVVLEKK